MKSELEIKIAEWEKELEPIIVEIAQKESELAFLKKLGPEEVVGERATSAKIGGLQGKVAVKAKEQIEQNEQFIKDATLHKEGLETLIREATERLRTRRASKP